MYADRLPPSDATAEESVIGSVLIDSDALAGIATFLRDTDFYGEKNRWCFEGMSELAKRGVAINQVTLAHELADKGRLEELGGSAYLSHLVMVTPTSVHIGHYARIVHQCSRARQLIQIGGMLADHGYHSPPHEADDNAIAVSQELIKLVEDSPDSTQMDGRTMSDIILSEMMELDNPLQRMPTGFRYLDGWLSGGMTPEELIIIGGRPGGGKSVISQNIMVNVLRQGKNALSFTIEMDYRRVIRRIISSMVSLPTGVLDDAVRNESQQAGQIIDAIGVIGDWGDRLIIDDNAAPSIEYIETVVRGRAASAHPPDLVIVDHLQQIGQEDGAHGATRNMELDEITRRLKVLARQHKMVVIATSQLNRAAVTRENKPPTMSELRDSGTIEQNADIVMLLHHPKSESNTKTDIKAQLILAKNRGGSTGDVGLRFQMAHSRFTEL